MFFLFRLFRRSTSAWVRWLLALVIVGGGIALLLYGIVGHSALLAVRGAILLALAVFIAFSVWRSRRPTRDERSRPL
ncbi:MAG: hypothetical protein ACRENY_01650 [Candidatus Dormibacteria bacterium]